MNLPPGGLSVVVPVYNSEATLNELVRRIAAACAGIGAEWELILVNDASRDGSWQEILRLARANSRLRGFDLARNYGQHGALLCGIRAARHPVIVTLDDDLQHPPEQIPTLLDCLGDDVDLVYGAPDRDRHGFCRLAGSFVLRRLVRTGSPWTAAGISSFRAFRTRLRDGFGRFDSPAVPIDVLLSWATRAVAFVDVPHAERAAGKSGYSAARLIRQAADTLTGFSAAPLRAAWWTGLVFLAAGIAGLALAATGHPAADTALFLGALATFSGIQLMALGWLGEYIGRIQWAAMNRPPYVVADTTVPDDEPPALQ